VRRTLKSGKKSLKTRFPDFKVVKGHQCTYLGKLVSSACYKQQVCVLTVFHARRAHSSKRTSFKKVPFWRFRLSGTPLPRSTKFCHRKLKSLWQPTVKISCSSLPPFS